MVLDYRILVQFYENDSWTDFPGGISEGTLLLEKGIVKNEIAFGVMYASKFEVQIFDVDENYAGKKVRVVKRKSGVADKALFTGQVESSNTDYTGVYRDLVAYDDFYYWRSVNVAGWWNALWLHEEGQTVSYTLAQLFTSLCTYVGMSVSAETLAKLSSLPNASMTVTDSEVEQYSKITFEDVVHSICELMGVFPSINGDGELELVQAGSGTPDFMLISNLDGTYTLHINTASVSSGTIDISGAEGVTLLNNSDGSKTLSIENDISEITIDNIELANSIYEDYTTEFINRIDVYLSSDDLYMSVGSGNNGYPISGNLFLIAKQDAAITSACNSLLNAINGIQFVPCSLKMIVSDLDFELGMRFNVDTNISYVFGLTLSGTQFIEQTIGCDARGKSITQKPSEINNERVLRSGVSNIVTKTGSVTIIEVNSIVDAAVSDATRIITGGSGSYIFLIKDSNGYITEICFADQPGADALGHPTAQNIWRWNAGGLGFSSTGYNGTFGTAITNNGQIVANYITAGTLSANVFNASSIFVSPNGSGSDAKIADALTNLQNQIDGTIETFSGTVAPTLNNYPASSWAVADYASHAGDLFVGEEGSAIQGLWYRFQYDSVNDTYQWVQLADNDIQKALTDAANALAIANGSVQTADVEYAASNSASVAPSSGWSTTPPQWSEGTFIWTRTKFMIYTYDPSIPDSQQIGTFWYSTPTCITGHTGASGQDGTSVTIVSREVRYQAYTSGTQIPTGTWLENPPAVDPGKYLWTRTTITYNVGAPVVSYSVSYMGTNGTPGQAGVSSYTYIRYSEYSNGVNPSTMVPSMYENPASDRLYIGICVTTSSTAPTTASSYSWSKYLGDDGIPGNGIENIYYTYKVTSTQTAPSGDSSGWSDSIPEMTPTNKYLWQRQVIDYTESGVLDKTTVALIGVYGDSGVDGISITGVVEYYAVNNDSAHAPTSWQTTPPPMDASHKYLWNYEQISYSRGNPVSTDPAIIGVYGADGRSVGSVVNYYYAGNETSASSLPAKGNSAWKTAVQFVDSTHRYLWNYENVLDTAGGVISSTDPAIIGSYSEDGTSVTIRDTSIMYQVSDQGTSVPQGTWVSTIPTVNQGQYLWTRTIVNYSPSGSTTSYSVSYKGTDGSPGTSSYTHIKYADDGQGTNMSDSPAGKKYIGIYVGSSSTKPSSASSYVWSKYAGDDGDPGNGIENIHFWYMTTTTQTAPAAGDSHWSSSLPEVTATNKYLWQKQVIDFTESGVADQTTIALLAVYGDTGISITEVEEWYAKSASSTTAPSSGWVKNSPPVLDSTNKYLWNYEVVKYSNNTTTTTTSSVVGVFSVDGRSIGSVINYYLATNASSGVTKNTSGWTTAVQSVSENAKYLWNYEVVKDTSNVTINETDPCIIGSYGEDGESVTISSTEIRYQVSNQGDSTPQGEWVSNIPQVDFGQYLWTRTTVTYHTAIGSTSTVSYSVAYKGTNGTSTYTHIRYASTNTPSPSEIKTEPDETTVYIGIANTDSPTAPETYSGYQWSKFVGEDGDPGNGITSISYFYMATETQSKPSAGDSHWSTEVPELSSSNRYLWQKQVIDYTDPNYSDQTNIVCIGVFGESAVVRYMQTTANGIVKTKDGIYDPETVTLTAYQKTGSFDPTSYSGRFIVYGVQEDGDLVQIYRSSVDESEINITNTTSDTLVIESTSGDITVQNDQLIIGSGAHIDGDTLYIDDDPNIRVIQNNALDGIRYLKCYLCEAGGTDTILDQETIAVVSEGVNGEDGTSFIWNLLLNTAEFPLTDTSNLISGVNNGLWRLTSGGNGTVNIFSLTDSPVQGLKNGFSILNNTYGNRDLSQDSIMLKSGVKYTISGYARKHSGSQDVNCSLRIWNATRGVAAASKTFTVTSGSWTRFEFYLTPTFTSGDILQMLIGMSNIGSIDYCGVKLEEGDVASPWSPAESDTLAYTVILTNESHTFAGSETAALQSSTSCSVVAYKGAERVPVKIGTITGMPSGMSVSVSSNDTVNAYFTVSVTKSMRTKNGVLDVPIVVGGKNFTKQFTYSLALKGVPGDSAVTRSIQVSPNVVIRNGNDISPTSISVSAFEQTGDQDRVSYSGRFRVMGSTDGSAYSTTIYQSSGNESSKTISISGISSSIKTIRCELYKAGGTSVLYDQQTIAVVMDGQPGADAYTVILSNENHTFAGDATSAVAGQSIDSQIISYKGTMAVAAHIGDISGVPTGMTVSKLNNDTTSAGFRVEVTGSMSTQSGVVTIPVILEYNTANAKTFNMKFTYSLALVGVGVDSIIELYYLSASSTVPSKPTVEVTTNTDVTEQWTKQVPTWAESTPYYYTCSEIHYDDGSIEWTDPVGNSALTQANQAASEAEDTAGSAAATADNAAATAEKAEGAANEAKDAVDELGDAVDELGDRVDANENDISDLKSNMNMLPNGMTLEDFYKNFLELQTGAVFSAFKVIDDGVHIMFRRDKVGGGYDEGEIWMDGANIKFFINGDLRSVINAEGFNFDYGILTTALQIGKTGDGTSTNSTWTWVKSQSGHFRLVYKG